MNREIHKNERKMAFFGLVPIVGTPPILLIISTLFSSANALDFCDQNYWCKEGHCCGNGRCCSYYYELWWFWLIWVLIALISCCCFYQQRRMRKRRRRRSSSRRSSNRASRSQASTTQSFFRPLFDPSKLLKLPTYEEVQDMPQDPPPYDIIYQMTLEESTIGGPSSSIPNHPIGATVETTQIHDELEEIDESPSASLLNNEEQVAIEVDMPYPSLLPPTYSTIMHQEGEPIGGATANRQPQDTSGDDVCSTDTDHLVNADHELPGSRS